MFKLQHKRTLTSKVKGFFMSPIQYEVRIPDGNWSPYFGDYEQQKWGSYDSNSCWCLSGVNCIEDQLEYLKATGQFDATALQFFTDNGFIDEDGDFSLSERFIEILGGCFDKGGDQMNFWTLVQKYGLIPRSQLTYTDAQASKFFSKEAFNEDYFNTSYVTPQMKKLGQDFLKHANVSKQWIGKMWETPSREILEAALKQAPLHIGIPIPASVYLWNNPFVKWDGKKTAQHAVELYAIGANGEYLIFDQYNPHLKTLSSDYYIPLVTQGIILPTRKIIVNPIPQDVQNDSLWTSIMNWFNGIFNKNLIGSLAR